MVPSKKLSGQNWLPDFFTDFFDGNIIHRIGGGPAMNVIEDDTCYKVELATPGICRKDVNIHVTKDNKVVIEVEKKCDDKVGCPEDKKDEKKDEKECNTKECKNKRFIRREFSYTKLHQTLALPENADKNGIEATVKHGVLQIIIPKLSSAQIEAENKVIEVK